jgi:hypothetical protein
MGGGDPESPPGHTKEVTMISLPLVEGKVAIIRGLSARVIERGRRE